MKFFLLVLLVSILFLKSGEGCVLTGHQELKYNHRGDIESFILRFSLQSGLLRQNYIKVYLPTAFSLAQGPEGRIYEDYDASRLAYHVLGTSYNIDHYYFLLQDLDLEPFRWYDLEIYFRDLITGNPFTGFQQDSIRISTSSSTDPSAQIIFDSNPIFSSFFIIPPPLSSPFFTSNITTPVFNFPLNSLSNPLNFQIRSTANLTENTIFYAEITKDQTPFAADLSSPDFFFNVGCEVKLNSSIDALVSCQIEQGRRMRLKISVAKPLSSGDELNVVSYVNAPNYWATSRVNVYAYEMGYNLEPIGQILQPEIQGSIEVNKIQITQSALKLLYGNDHQDPAFVNNLLFAERLSDNNLAYNSLRIEFTVNQSYQMTNETLSSELTIDLADLGVSPFASPQVLSHSISTNLPYFLTPVRCLQLISPTPQLLCKNLGSLLSGVTYHVSFKLRFTASTGSTANITLGRISLAVKTPGGIDLGVFLSSSPFSIRPAVSDNTISSTAPPVSQQNTQVFGILEDSSFHQKVYMDKIYDTGSPSTTVYQHFGVNIYQGQNQALVFFIDFAQHSGAATTHPDSELEIVFNNKIIEKFPSLEPFLYFYKTSETTPTTSCGSLVTGGTCDNAHSSTNFMDTHMMKFKCTGGTNCKDLVGSIASAVLMRNIRFKSTFSSSQILVTENTLDFVARMRFIDPIPMTGSTFTFQSLLNAYTLTPLELNQRPNIVFDFLNYQNTVQDPDQVVFLRLRGQNLDFLGSKRLGIFLDHGVVLEYFEVPSEPEAYQCSVQCVGYRVENSEYTVSGTPANNQNYLFNQLITFNVEDLGTSQLDVFIPIAARSLVDVNHIHIAFLDDTRVQYAWALSSARQGVPQDTPLFSVPAPAPGAPPTWDYGVKLEDSRISFAGTTASTIDSTFFGDNGGILVLSKYVNVFQGTQVEYTLSSGVSVKGIVNRFVHGGTERNYLLIPLPAIAESELTANTSKVGAISGIPNLGFIRKNYKTRGLFSFFLFNNQGTRMSDITDSSLVYTYVSGSETNPCTLLDLQSFQKEKYGLKFRLQINNPIRLDESLQEGFGGLSIRFKNDPVVSTSTSSLILKTTCAAVGLETEFSCVAQGMNLSGTDGVLVILTLTPTHAIRSIDSLVVRIDLDEKSALADIMNQTDSSISAEVYLPYHTGTDFNFYGNSYGTPPLSTDYLLTTCTGRVNLNGITSSGTLSPPVLSFESTLLDTRSELNITFSLTGVVGIDEILPGEHLEIDLEFIHTQSNNLYACVLFVDDFERPYFGVRRLQVVGSRYQFTLRDRISRATSRRFLVRCRGGSTPRVAPTSPQGVRVSWLSPSGEVLATAGQAMDLPFAAAKPPDCVLQSQSFQFLTEGFGATYLLTMQIAKNLFSYSSVLVEFPSEFLPQLARQDATLSCLIDGLVTLCEVVRERRLRVLLRKSVLSNTPFVLTIQGVTFRAAQSNLLWWFGISVAGENDLQNLDCVLSTAISQPSPHAVSTADNVAVLRTVQNTEKTDARAAPSYSFTFQLLTTPIPTSEKLYLQHFGFDNYIDRRTSLACSLTNQSASQSVSCLYISNRLIEVTNSYSLQVGFIYNLTIQNLACANAQTISSFRLLSPSRQPFYPRAQILLFFSSNQSNVTQLAGRVSHKSLLNLTVFNAPRDLRQITSDPSRSYFEIAKGYFSNNFGVENFDGSLFQENPALVRNVVGDLEWNQSVVLYPEFRRAKISDARLVFRIAARSLQETGFQFLLMVLLDQQSYVARPPEMKVFYTDRKCAKIRAEFTSYTVPHNGTSIPIVLDFAECFPADNILVTAALANATAGNIVEATKELKYDSGSFENTRLSFLVQGLGVAPLTTTLSFSVGGTNSASYEVIPAITVSFVNAASVAGAATGTIDVTDFRDQVLRLRCTKAGDTQTQLLYYAYYLAAKPLAERYLDPSVAGSTNSALKEQQELLFIQNQIEGLRRGDVRFHEDPYWSVYSSAYQVTGTDLVVRLAELKIGATYEVTAFCVNQLGQVSAKASNNFTVDPRDESLLRIRVYFEGRITRYQEKLIACALVQLLSVERSRVISTDHITCDSSIALSYPYTYQIVFGNETGSRRRILQSATLQSYFYYIQPDNIYNPTSTASKTQALLQILDLDDVILRLEALYPGDLTALPQIAFIETVQRQALSIPALQEATLAIGESNITFSFQSIFSSGQIMIGIDYYDRKIPTAADFRAKLNRNQRGLVYHSVSRISTTASFSTQITRLSDDVDYSFYFMFTSDNPGVDASHSEVQEIYFRIDQKWVIPDNHSTRLALSILSLFVFICALI